MPDLNGVVLLKGHNPRGDAGNIFCMCTSELGRSWTQPFFNHLHAHV